MTNPLVHALAVIAAVLIPGGLLVYFAWRTARSASSSKGEPNQTPQKEGFEDISEAPVTPDEALEAFLEMYPKYPKDSLRAKARSSRLYLHKTRPKKKPQ